MTADRIKREAIYALSFYDRSLFYADKDVVSDEAPSAAPYEYPVILETVEDLDRQLGALDYDEDAKAALIENCLFKINEVYSDGIEFLLTRLERTSDDYCKKGHEVLDAGITVADREFSFALKARDHAAKRYTSLLDESENELHAMRRLTSEDYCDEELATPYPDRWKLVREFGSVLADEITFLSARVDDFQNLLNAKKSQEDTQESLANAEESLRVAEQSIKLTNDSLDLSNKSLRYARLGVNWAIGATVLSTILTLVTLVLAYQEAQKPAPDHEQLISVISELKSLAASEEANLKLNRESFAQRKGMNEELQVIATRLDELRLKSVDDIDAINKTPNKQDEGRESVK